MFLFAPPTPPPLQGVEVAGVLVAGGWERRRRRRGRGGGGEGEESGDAAAGEEPQSADGEHAAEGGEQRRHR